MKTTGDRIDLAGAVPLAAPLVLYVEPTNVCNFRCPICPESLPDYQTAAGYYQAMTDQTWERISDSLGEWPKLRVMRFFATGEPLLDPKLPAMIRDGARFADRTELTTNASRLCGPMRGALLTCGLDYLRVSVYGTTTAAYEKAIGRGGYHFDEILWNVMTFRRGRDAMHLPRPYIYAELVSQDPEEQDQFREQWTGIADGTGVKALHNWGGDTLVQLGAPSKKLVCPYPFYELFVHADGEVTVCCVDWKGDLAVGNVNTQTLREIWEGEKLRGLQRIHLEGRRSMLGPCRDCSVPDTCPDDLDSLVLEAKCGHS